MQTYDLENIIIAPYLEEEYNVSIFRAPTHKIFEL